MPLINTFFNLINSNRLKDIEFFSKHPLEVQKNQFDSLIRTAKDTWWGKEYDYASIKTIEDFQQRVPLQKYESFYKNVDRIRKGEENVLWPGKITWFAKSSGTTNDKSKFIPVTHESLHKCHFRGGRDSMAIYIRNNPSSKLLLGKTLTLGGSHQIDYFDKHARSGDLSAIMLQNIPKWADILRSPPKKIALIAKWEEKLEKFTQYALHKDIRGFAGVPSWNLVMLKHILDVTGKNNLLEVWPNMELFLHGGVNFAPYREQYQQLIPSENMHYMETYNASEGFFAIQNIPGDESMLLMLDYGIFYEFIPMDEYYSENFKAIHLGEVLSGINYAVVISTNGGLWRYVLGDTVIFTSIKPYKILITGRTRHFINAFGEEVIIDNAEKALMEACQKTGAIVHEYTVAPVFMDKSAKGRHEWLIEFEKMPESLELFTDILDKSLMSINSDYEAKRYNSFTLEIPLIRSMKKGSFYKWFQQKNKLGGQNKIPRLSNDRKYVDELLKIDEF
jgi:hypothetical protein